MNSPSRAVALTQAPWWTEADDAEFDVLIDAFVRCARLHRERCAVCSTDGPWCQPLREAFEGVIEWREGRILRSKAAYLRALYPDPPTERRAVA